MPLLTSLGAAQEDLCRIRSSSAPGEKTAFREFYPQVYIDIMSSQENFLLSNEKKLAETYYTCD